MKSVFKPAILIMSGRAAGFIATFVIPIVLVRIFNRSEFGTYKQLFLVYTTLYGIAQLGMAESLFYFIPSSTARDRGRYTFNAIVVLIMAGVLSKFCLTVFGSDISRWLNNRQLTEYLPYIGLFLLFMLGSTVLEISMISGNRHLHASSTYVLSDCLKAVFCILPALVFRQLAWIIGGMVLFSGLRFSATVIYVIWNTRGEFRPDLHLLRRQLNYAIPFAFAVLIEMAQSKLHMYVVSSNYDSAMFAIYAIGCLQIPLVDFMMTSTSSVMMVKIRENIQAGNPGSVIEIWRNTTRKLMLVAAPMVGGLLVVSHALIVTLFTQAYSRSVALFQIWAFSIVFSALLSDSMLRVYARMRLLILVYTLQLLVIATLIGPLMHWFGLAGAVLASVIATAVAKAVGLDRVRVILGAKLRELLPWRDIAMTFFIAAAAALPAILINTESGLTGFPLLISSGFAYALCYGVLLLLFGPISALEKRELSAVIKSPILRLHRTLREPN